MVRCHGQLKAAVRARLASAEWLPWVLRSAPKEDSSVSSAELMFTVQHNIQSAEPPAEQLLGGEAKGDGGADLPATDVCRGGAKPPGTALIETSHV
jgi:hypothetical protein